jgi:Tctex-1 family
VQVSDAKGARDHSCRSVGETGRRAALRERVGQGHRGHDPHEAEECVGEGEGEGGGPRRGAGQLGGFARRWRGWEEGGGGGCSAGLELPRYKYVVQVVVGENKGEGARVSTRCMWDPATDALATESFTNDSLFAVATAYGVYLY